MSSPLKKQHLIFGQKCRVGGSWRQEEESVHIREETFLHSSGTYYVPGNSSPGHSERNEAVLLEFQMRKA